MKRLLTAAIALAALVSAAAAEIPASDVRITYTGRTLVQGKDVSFDWSGVILRVRFSGTRLSMDCSDSGTDWFNCWIDREPAAEGAEVIKVTGKCRIEFNIPGADAPAVHELVLQKRTEGEQGRMTVHSFDTDGELLQARGPGKRLIEFIGDSYTCGYGTEGADRDQPFRASEENCNLSYCNILGRFFDADVSLISHSGRGVARNYGDGDPGGLMPERYLRTFDMYEQPAWKPAAESHAPDIVVIYLGTNDFSVGKQPSLWEWTQGYYRLLCEVRAFYGDSVPILCVASKADDALGDYVRHSVDCCGMPGVHWTSIQKSAHNDGSDLGAGWHPNYAGQRKVAACMIPYIATLTGWDMPFKAIE